jgi:molybdopterin/thiamine biosynthesis adenylyltransferase
LPGVTLVEDWAARTGQWSLEIGLDIGAKASGDIPSVTRWYVVTSGSYPDGSIEIYPARSGGITTTFLHQSHNSSSGEDRAWTRGNLCLTHPAAGVLRKMIQSEPIDADARLRWRVERALEWLELAASGSLSKPGDPYEVPPLPTTGREMVAFNEGSDTFPVWNATGTCFGVFRSKLLNSSPTIRIVSSFFDETSSLILTPSWGRLIREEPQQETGLWIKLSDEPLLDHWHVPDTWEQLHDLLARKGISLDQVFRDTYGHLRNASAPLVALGFPIPATVASPHVQLHWFFIQLPVLRARGEKKKQHRYPKAVFWERDRTLNLSGAIDWLSSENWSPESLGSRGRLPAKLTTRSVLLLGAGALGATLAELLVRGGVYKLAIVDGDFFAAGNLVRHTLDMSNIGHGKATGLAQRLNHISPHADVQGFDSRFSANDAKMRSLAMEEALVIDCTAEDGVARALETIKWNPETLLCSFSISYGAERLYAYAERVRFDSSHFFSVISPLLSDDLEKHGPETFPREGVGCWHPVFPARVERVTQAACKAIGFLAEKCDVVTDAGHFEVL